MTIAVNRQLYHGNHNRPNGDASPGGDQPVNGQPGMPDMDQGGPGEMVKPNSTGSSQSSSHPHHSESCASNAGSPRVGPSFPCQHPMRHPVSEQSQSDDPNGMPQHSRADSAAHRAPHDECPPLEHDHILPPPGGVPHTVSPDGAGWTADLMQVLSSQINTMLRCPLQTLPNFTIHLDIVSRLNLVYPEAAAIMTMTLVVSIETKAKNAWSHIYHSTPVLPVKKSKAKASKKKKSKKAKAVVNSDSESESSLDEAPSVKLSKLKRKKRSSKKKAPQSSSESEASSSSDESSTSSTATVIVAPKKKLSTSVFPTPKVISKNLLKYWEAHMPITLGRQDCGKWFRSYISESYVYKRGKEPGTATALSVTDDIYQLFMNIAVMEMLEDNFPTAVYYTQEVLKAWEATPNCWTVSIGNFQQDVWDWYHQRIIAQKSTITKTMSQGTTTSYPSKARHTKIPLAGFTVLPTMATDALSLPAPSLTPVPDVDLKTTIPKHITPPEPPMRPQVAEATVLPDLSNLFPIVTKLCTDAWTELLTTTGGLEKFLKVPEGLQSSFLISVENYTLSHTFTPHNHSSAYTFKHIIEDKFKSNIELSHIFPGYDPSQLQALIGPFHTSPMVVIEQKPSKFHIIINHSYPHTPANILHYLHPHPDTQDLQLKNRLDEDIPPMVIDPEVYSVNSLIDYSRFQCAWGTFSQCWLIVANAPPGTQAAVFNVDMAFQNIPIHPSSRCFVALLFNGLVHILLHSGVEALVKWVDDFIFFHTNGSYSYSYNESLIWSITEKLRWPWAHSKFLLYISFLWDLENKTIELPESKKVKYSNKITTWLSADSHTKDETKSVVGTLQHVTLVIPHSRAYLASLHCFVAGFTDDSWPFLHHKYTKSVWNDLTWWLKQLQLPFLGLHIVKPPPIDNSISLFVDASTSWGIRLVLNGRWLAWQFRPNWSGNGCHIGWAEMVAVKLAILTLVTSHIKNTHIWIRSDNQGVVSTLQAGYSRGQAQNASLHCIVDCMQQHAIWLSVEWVPSKDNIADALSQGSFPSRAMLYSHVPRLNKFLSPYLNLSVDFHDSRLILSSP
ncbi:hypothetical protein D9758_013431 [Tetrapyrgos nigripes]|uniref:RNase H type-1 domain-containing protein n=1 Tax=Tetrapyrgos nigripes TaxID=182062 RepID=A0A8H5CK67_9AGAR|nr:hypothetical protein D9758_013431 [Tetrapyrgos nigripes]